MPDRRSRKPLWIFLSLFAAIVLVIAAASFIAAERRLRAFCSEARPGANWPALAMAAGSRGLKVLPPRDGRPARVTDSAAFGRTVCSIEVGADAQVVSTRYHSND